MTPIQLQHRLFTVRVAVVEDDEVKPAMDGEADEQDELAVDARYFKAKHTESNTDKSVATVVVQMMQDLIPENNLLSLTNHSVKASMYISKRRSAGARWRDKPLVSTSAHNVRGGKPPKASRKSTIKKKHDLDNNVRDQLYEWRRKMKKERYPRALWAPPAILADDTCALIASMTPITALSHLEQLVKPHWARWDELGQELFEALSVIAPALASPPLADNHLKAGASAVTSSVQPRPLKRTSPEVRGSVPKRRRTQKVGAASSTTLAASTVYPPTSNQEPGPSTSHQKSSMLPPPLPIHNVQPFSSHWNMPIRNQDTRLTGYRQFVQRPHSSADVERRYRPPAGTEDLSMVVRPPFLVPSQAGAAGLSLLEVEERLRRGGWDGSQYWLAGSSSGTRGPGPPSA
ncbi:hypothetical protein OF83DRAFT_1085311 [Amylostereum chailletii]|nr:hypothetical protein OF83DRAFT_1085311 [Amylostereum chailletii]